MPAIPTPTRTQLLKLIDNLEKNPSDKIGILGVAGMTVMSGGLATLAVGPLATAAGATSIFGVTTAAGWIGVTVAMATPVGWIIGGAAVAGAVAYAFSRLILGGGMAEGRRSELLQKYREDAKNIEAKERAGNIAADDRTQFILSLRELIDKDAIPPETAFKLIEQVEQGRIPLTQAFNLIQSLLKERLPSTLRMR